VLEDLRSLRAASIVIRPNPLQASAWAAIDRPGVVTIPRQAHVLDLRGGVEAVQSRLPRAMRRGIRTAVKRGVRVELDHDGRLLPIYDQLYRISMARWAQRQREPLALARLRASLRDPREKLHHMSKCMAGAFRLYVAFVDDEPAAASIMLIGRTAHYTRGAMDREVASRARANELLHWEMIQAACAAGCATYHMGETGQSSTLAEFKERVGGRPVDYAEYRIERLPLTRFDQMLRSGVKRAIGFQDNPKPCMETSHARRS
jgi:lipid II:glycine glycyltransferase (peptidoglycan interpeptide bridge formation enzyme)